MTNMANNNSGERILTKIIQKDIEKTLTVKIRYDDRCNNGHKTFAITGSFDGAHGCIHDIIAQHMPEIAPFIKWHSFTSKGPLYYIENTIYSAGNRDHWGLLKGEFRQHTSRGPYQNNGVEGVPNWELELPKEKDKYSSNCPEPITLKWKPHGIIGEGKERELDIARKIAVWPEATDEELSVEPEELKKKLMERLPKLMQDFKQAVELLGFIY